MIYPVDSIIQPLNNRGLVNNKDVEIYFFNYKKGDKEGKIVLRGIKKIKDMILIIFEKEKEKKFKRKKKSQVFPYRESNPGRLGENQES